MNNLLWMMIALGSGTASIAASLESTLKNSHYTDYGYVLVSLAVVICLIYITGIVYSKLNNFGVKTMKALKKDANDDKIIIISTTPLGANRSLHVVELNGKKMLIGASTNSIHLIKDLSENIELIEESSSEPVENNETEAPSAQTVDDEDFGLYKKYLR